MVLIKTKIKSCVLRLAAVAIMSVVIVSCGGGGSGGTNSELIQSENSDQPSETSLPGGAQVNALADGTWKLGEFVFITDFNGQTLQNNRDDNVLIVVGTHLFDTSNGNYAGSVIRITLSLTGSGDYVVTDASSSASAFGSGAKVASIEVIAGATSNNATQWDSTETSGTLVVSVNADGRYFVSTTEPIIVTKAFESGTGVVGSPDQISLEMRNINADPV